MLTIIDEFTRKSLMIKVDFRLNSQDVLDALYKLFITEGIPEYIRSDNGSEFMAKLIAAGIPFGIVLQSKETVESYAKQHDITLPDPPKRPPIGQFNQVA